MRAALLSGLGALFFLYAGHSFGSASSLPRTTSESLGMADANVALSSGPEAVFINPANLAAGNQGWSVGSMFAQVDVTFTPRSGNAFDAERRYPLVPYAAASTRLSEHLILGFSVDSPFGIGIAWKDDAWRTPYNLDLAQEVDLTVVRAGPALAWQLDPRWSVGGRVFAQYVEAMDKSDFAHVEGDGVSAGYQVGVRWRGARVIFASAYTSRTDTEIEGSITSVHPIAAAGGTVAGPAKASVLLPDRWQTGVAFALAPRFWWEVDLDWFGWAYYDELNIVQSDGRLANAGKNARDSHNTVSLRTGLKWQYSDGWTWHAGVGYDPSPAPEHHVSSVSSMLRKTRAAFGAQRRVSKDLTLGFAYQYIRGHSRRVEETTQDTLGGVDTNLFEGTYESESHALGLSLSGQF